MAYYKRSKRTGLKYIRRRKPRGKMNKIVKTVNQLVKAQKQDNKVIRKALWSSPSTFSSSDVYQAPLTLINSGLDIFGTGSNDQHANYARHIKMNLKLHCDAYTENELIGCSIFVVSLKNRIADSKFIPDPANPNRPKLQLTSGADYIQGGGMTYLNKDVFNIHYSKQFNFTNLGATNSSTGVDGTLSFDKTVNVKMNHKIVNSGGDFGNLDYPTTPSHNYFLLAFTDNLATDGESPRDRKSNV